MSTSSLSLSMAWATSTTSLLNGGRESRRKETQYEKEGFPKVEAFFFVNLYILLYSFFCQDFERFVEDLSTKREVISLVCKRRYRHTDHLNSQRF